MLLRVQADAQNINDIIGICNIFEARIIEATADSVMIEFAGDLEKEAAFMSIISQHKILELARTGVIALAKQQYI